jgi:hypothetical protein
MSDASRNEERNMQLVPVNDGSQRSRLSDHAYTAIDRDYAAIRRCHKTRFDKPFKRSAAEQLAEYYETVVRNADGSINFDAYRKRASALRSREVGNGTVLGLACASILTLCCACAVIFAIAAFTAPKPSTRGVISTVVSTHP